MLRRAACLHTKCATPASARAVIRKRPHVRCLQHSVSTVPFFSSRSIVELPPQTLKSAAFFSSVVPRREVKENGGNDHARYIDAAVHAELKTLKKERRKTHEGLLNRAVKKKEMSRRRILAEELMRFFAINDECYNITLRELNVDKSLSSDEYQYRQFYLDSLQSFGAMLSEDDEDALAQVGLSTASAISILDQFAVGGFAHNVQEFSKKYRTMATISLQAEELNSTLKQLQKNHEGRLQEWKAEEQLLEPMESERVHKREVIASLGGKVDSAKELLPLLKNSEKNELDELANELSNALAQLEALSKSKTNDKDLIKQRNKVIQAKGTAANLAIKISTLESEISGLKLPMSQDEFQATTENNVRIAPSVAPALAKFITSRHDDFDKYRQLAMHTDLTTPHEWYPHARLDKRKIIFHAGPTNSGKTYNALQRLKQAKKGMYLAPLRLLAAEIYETLTAEGIYTDLLTGQEKRNVPFSTHRSSTVELASIEEDYDVVVIDEIQMLCDEFRGSAWTRALLGVRCKEIHVCGGAEGIDIVKKICGMCGDDFELHRYERFSDLKVLDDSLAKSPTSKGSYENVQPGDCVVAFSKRDIFAIKREIETNTSFKCCVIYGSLPPDVRAEQARRFNDPSSEYEILVASDAIGMGLNLSIKRIIFNSIFKHNGDRIVQLDHSSVKQIAGRAGRRNSPYPNGEVTCRDPNDMAHLKKCMGSEIRPLTKAGIIPTTSHIAVFNQHLEEHSSSGKEIELHQTLRKFSEMATLKGDFFLCRKQSMEVVSLWLKDIKNMSPAEKFVLCMSPVNENCVRSRNVLLRYVEKYTTGKVPGLHYSMQPKAAKSFDHLADLCSVHHQLELFLWLQNKLPSNAVEVLRAVTLKDKTIEMINNGLFKAEKLSLSYDYISKDVRFKKEWASERKEEE